MSEKLPPAREKTESRKRFIINFVFFLIIFGLSVLLVRYALPALTAFFIAAVVVFLLRPLAKVLHSKLKLNYKISSMVLVIVFYATAGVAAFIIVYELIDWVVGAVKQLPRFFGNTVMPTVNAASARLDEFVANFDPDNSIDVSGVITDILDKVYSALGDFSASALKLTPGIAKSVSSTLIGIIICVISTAFGLTDYDLIKAFLHRQLSPKHSKMLYDVSTSLGRLLKKYGFSYALIMIITFAEIAVGLLIIGYENAFTWAALIAVFDILPIVGSGMVLFPWAVVTLILGNVPQGIGLLILWAIVIIVRNIIEPKIIGNNVGMHPLLTLFAMFAGNFIYGGIGILLLPITLALIQSLNNDGIIHVYKPLPKHEFEGGEKNRVDRFFDRLGDAIFSFFKKVFRAIGRFFAKVFKRKKATPSPEPEKPGTGAEETPESASDPESAEDKDKSGENGNND
ncbi:MAG: sporulation integral membrane protein YtvI [Clostridia bacterium]|nr:sporulation integral membrane protein YtvI [Clostridia bacterium]MBP5270060.1 sporulation integral membrane protein YtvI [Clostridia bacterium]